MQYLKEAAIAAQNFEPAKLRHLQEAIGSKHNGTVGQVGVADAKVLLDTLNGGGEIEGNTREALGCCHLLAQPGLQLSILHQQ